MKVYEKKASPKIRRKDLRIFQTENGWNRDFRIKTMDQIENKTEF